MPIWTIRASGVSGGNTKSDLVGCHITTNDGGTAYEFTDNNPNVVLATTTGTSLPTPPFTFPTFGLDGYTWTIVVNTLTGGSGSNQAQGTWSNNAPSISAGETGDYTAQAGSTIDEDIPEEDASTASA